MWDNKARAALAETFLNALKEDRLPWHQCWSAGLPMSFSTGKPYRGINNLMLSYVANERGYQDTRWMTYKYAQDHGWQVRKGEKSVRVECWRYYDTKLKKNLDCSEVARIQKEDPERMKNIRLAAYVYNVFNVEQIDGDIPPQERGTVQDPEAIRMCRDEFLANLGVGFQSSGGQAFYSPELDKITLPPMSMFDSTYGYVCTLLHEAGHATGHSSRLDRPIKNAFGSPDYAREELRAEIASAFTAQALHLPHIEGKTGSTLDNLTGNHKAYIQSWISSLEDDPNELFAAIKDADKITDYLLEHGKLLELVEVAYLQSHFSFEYRLLSRLRSDCEYFLNAGGRHEKHLWAGSVRDQIDKMRELYDLLPFKPDWLSSEGIDQYEKRMMGPASSSLENNIQVEPVELEGEEHEP